MSLISANPVSSSRSQTSLAAVPPWAWFGAVAFVLLVVGGNRLLHDADTYWQIEVGQWMLDHRAWPHTDIYSFTKFGEPWISTSWLAQVIFAASYNVAGWAGPVWISAFAIAAAYALFVHLLCKWLAPRHAVLIALAAVLMSMAHFLARPHVLVLPVMLAWADGLATAADARRVPSWALLPLIVLWANLHGGFVFGAALVAPFALVAVWEAEANAQRGLLTGWFVFGLAALAAACLTPYGWNSILAARNILELGDAMPLIPEWLPANFARPEFFEIAVMVCIGGLLVRGLTLSWPRMLLVLGLLFMALSHNRSIEIFALLAPLVIAKPLIEQWRLAPVERQTRAGWAGIAALVAVTGAASVAIATAHPSMPRDAITPVAAVEALKTHHPRRIFNTAGFGGYLITQQIPVFIDGRAELYGERFVVDTLNAAALKDVDLFLNLLKANDIDATLLTSNTPAVKLLDRLPGWKRVYTDDRAVVHIRSAISEN
ncbi:Glycosyltransferase RgtA/B/C/D-like domain-containing protein OS=Afipia felis OX=1035 GN=NCTC12722_03049 PE=4 SV=1 [Afipia felis]